MLDTAIGGPTDARTDFFQAQRVATEALALDVKIGSLHLGSPVMPASGCFGPELAQMFPVETLGAAVTKTVFAHARGGNSGPRVGEFENEMVNSVGIPSEGPEGYLKNLHPKYVELGLPVIISVGGLGVRDYARVISNLGDAGDAFELNVSCPNLEAGGTEIGADPAAIFQATSLARAETAKALIVKLAPMVSSIAECAKAAEDAGADGVCVANSIPCLVLDPVRLKPSLGNEYGGLTGTSLRPIILRLVRQCAEAVSIPIIGCGGVRTAQDALEYFALGASAVQVGTATFSTPHSAVTINSALIEMCRSAGAESLVDLVMTLQGNL